jgi:hypothetical protein
MFADQLIKLMPPGTFTSVEGIEVAFSQADLEGAAASYDAASDPAPIVVGHPKLDDPAFGWVQDVVFQDGHLCARADPEKLDPAFAEAVAAGRYAKVSAKFYLPDAPGNPKPGRLYLKHVGFLGAAAPAVKGLGRVSFAEDPAGAAVTIETQTPKENVMSDKDKKDQEASFAEREAALDSRAAELDAQAKTLAAREAAASEAAVKARHDGNVAFAEALVEGGKLAPAGKELLVVALDGLEAEKTVSFGEGDGKQDLTPLAALKKLAEGAGKLIAFGEHAKADGAGDAHDPSDIADRAVAFAEKQRAAGRTITIAQAVRIVNRGGDG